MKIIELTETEKIVLIQELKEDYRLLTAFSLMRLVTPVEKQAYEMRVSLLEEIVVKLENE